MIKFLLLCAGFVIMLGLLLGFSVIRMFRQLLFGSGSQQNKRNQQQTRSNASRQQQQQRPPQKKKIIEKDEGEYVDFEEVK